MQGNNRCRNVVSHLEPLLSVSVVRRGVVLEARRRAASIESSRNSTFADGRSAELIVEADARQAAAGVVVEARLEGRDSRNSGADVPRVAEIVVHIFALDRPIACELVLGTSADRPADLHARTRCKIVNRS